MADRADWDYPGAGKQLEDSDLRQVLEGLRGVNTPPIVLAQSLDAGATTVSTLGVDGAATIAGAVALLSTLSVAGAVTLDDIVTINGGTTINDALDVNGQATLTSLLVNTTAAIIGDASVNGLATLGSLRVVNNTELGDALTDTVLISGDLTVNRDISVQRNLDVDGTTVLSTTTIVGAGAGNDQALFLKHNSGAGQFTLGATNAADPVLVFKDHSGDQTFEVGNNSSTYQAKVTGDFNVSDDSVFDGDISASRAVIGGTTFSGTEELRVVGQTRLEGATEITTGSLTVAGGISAGASSAFTGGLTVVTGGLTVSAGGADINGAVAITNDTSTTAMLFLGAAAFTQTTVGAAGGASAMPTPDGYLRVNVKGGSRVIPYCNA
jgi:fibronectin-binding autotransporter adhesin